MRPSWPLFGCFSWPGRSPWPGGAEDGGETWFDLSDFNPLGKLFDPVEQAILHLTIKGMLRHQTRFPLRSDDAFDSQDLAQGIVGRKRHWDFDNLEWLGELELRYQPTPSLELVNIWHLQYDAIYDWDHWWRRGDKGTIRVFPDGRQRRVHPNQWIEREMEYYHSSDRYLRELYLNWTQGPFNLVLGKQQQVWGKIDFALIDVLNPVDRRMGNIYGLGDAVHASGDVDVFLEPKHTRLHRLGATFDKTVYFWRRDWLFIYEGMATFNQYFPVSDLVRFNPRTGNPIGFTRRSPETLNFLKGVRSSRSDGLAKRNWMLNALQVDTHALQGHLVISGIYIHNMIFGRDGHIFFPARNHGSLNTFFLGLNYWPGRWEGRWWLRYGLRLFPEQGSYWMNFRTDYTFSSYLKATLNLWLWDGNQNDGPDGLFRNRDLVDLRFEYNF